MSKGLELFSCITFTILSFPCQLLGNYGSAGCRAPVLSQRLLSNPQWSAEEDFSIVVNVALRGL